MSTFDILDQIKQNFDKNYSFSTVEKMTSNSKFGVFVIKNESAYLILLHLLYQFKKFIKIATFLNTKFAKKALKVIMNVKIMFIR